MANILNQFGISQAVADMLMADNGTLYGKRKLTNYISADPVKFQAAKANVIKPYRMYIWTPDSDPLEERASNDFDDYRVDFKLSAKATKKIDVYERFAQTWERVKVIARSQMKAGGLQMQPYYTDPNAQIYSIMVLANVLPPPTEDDDGLMVTELEGGILIQVNRW